jgi:5'-3' exonuclease
MRVEVDDLEKTRWKDEQLAVFLAKSARRINQLAIRNELDFAMQASDVVLKPDGTIEGIIYGEVNAVCLLTRKDNGTPLKHLLPMHYLTIKNPTSASVWTFLNGQAEYKIPMAEDVPAVFLHYPLVTISTSLSPWDGRLDDLIVEYASLRAKNTDEMNLTQDTKMLAELEKTLLANFNRLQPQIAPMKGWIY